MCLPKSKSASNERRKQDSAVQIFLESSIKEDSELKGRERISASMRSIHASLSVTTRFEILPGIIELALLQYHRHALAFQFR